MKYTAVIAAFNIDNIAVHNIDIAVAYLYPDIVPYIMLKHSVKNAFYSFAAEWLQNISVCLDAVACYCIFGSDSREYQQVIVALISEFSCNVYPQLIPDIYIHKNNIENCSVFKIGKQFCACFVGNDTARHFTLLEIFTYQKFRQ